MGKYLVTIKEIKTVGWVLEADTEEKALAEILLVEDKEELYFRGETERVYKVEKTDW